MSPLSFLTEMIKMFNHLIKRIVKGKQKLHFPVNAKIELKQPSSFMSKPFTVHVLFKGLYIKVT